MIIELKKKKRLLIGQDFKIRNQEAYRLHGGSACKKMVTACLCVCLSITHRCNSNATTQHQTIFCSSAHINPLRINSDISETLEAGVWTQVLSCAWRHGAGEKFAHRTRAISSRATEFFLPPFSSVLCSDDYRAAAAQSRLSTLRISNPETNLGCWLPGWCVHLSPCASSPRESWAPR